MFEDLDSKPELLASGKEAEFPKVRIILLLSQVAGRMKASGPAHTGSLNLT